MTRRHDSRQAVFGLSPWLVVGVSLILGLAVLGLTWHSSRQEKQYLQQNMLNRADALIWALEAGTRAMMSMGGQRALLQSLVEETARLPGVRYLMVVDTQGNILAHSNVARVGQILSPGVMPPVLPAGQRGWRLQSAPGGDTFEVYQRFVPLRGAGGMMGMMGDSAAALPGSALVVVGLNMAPYEASLIRARRASLLVAALVLLLGMAGVVSLFWAHHYRRSQSQLQHTRALANEIVASLPLALLTCDNQQRIVTANAHAVALLQMPSAWEGIPLSSVAGPDWAEIISTLGPNPRLLERDMTLEVTPGVHIPLSISASQVRDEQGARLGAVFILRDLTQVKQLQDQVERHQRLSALGQLAAGVAHEIRNPLSSIKGLATYLAGKFTPDGPEHLAARTLIDEVERLNRVVSELLDFARPGDIVLQEGDVAPVIQRALRLVASDASTKAIALVFAPDSHLPCVMLNEDRLAQCLLNLLINAIQAMTPGGVIHVTTRLSLTRERLLIAVADTGSGIAPQDLDAIFTPYFTTKPSGTGLGLAIVHQIIEKHHGEITVESHPGAGSIFTIGLPVNNKQMAQ